MSSFISSLCNASSSHWWFPSHSAQLLCFFPLISQVHPDGFLQHGSSKGWIPSALCWDRSVLTAPECPSLSVKGTQWVLAIFCSTGATLLYLLLQWAKHQSTNQPVISPSPSSPLVLTLLPSVVFAHPIKSSPSQMPSMFSIWVLLFTWSLSPSSRCDRLI